MEDSVSKEHIFADDSSDEMLPSDADDSSESSGLPDSLSSENQDEDEGNASLPEQNKQQRQQQEQQELFEDAFDGHAMLGDNRQEGDLVENYSQSLDGLSMDGSLYLEGDDDDDGGGGDDDDDDASDGGGAIHCNDDVYTDDIQPVKRTNDTPTRNVDNKPEVESFHDEFIPDPEQALQPKLEREGDNQHLEQDMLRTAWDDNTSIGGYHIQKQNYESSGTFQDAHSVEAVIPHGSNDNTLHDLEQQSIDGSFKNDTSTTDSDLSLNSSNNDTRSKGGERPEKDNDLHGNNKDTPDELYQEEYAKELSCDTFSFMIVAPISSVPFMYAMFVFCLQLTCFFLVAANLTDFGSDNTFSIPANVESAVRITQILALLMAVVTQEDVRGAFSLLINGYSERKYHEFAGEATFFKWSLSVACRFVEGSLGLVVTFILIVAEDNVVDVLLNFTAMEFVSQLDKVAFSLAQQGYANRANIPICDVITVKRYYSRRSKVLSRTAVLVTILVALLYGWFRILVMQQSGHFLCSTVLVQFSDTFQPAMASFSGYYDRASNPSGLRSSRVEYIERKSGRAKFAYCTSESRWTFVFDKQNDPGEDNEMPQINPCEWIATSEETSEFDILKVTASPWVVRSDNLAEVPIQHFRMECQDCHPNDRRACGNRGMCSNDNTCRCDQVYFGRQCQFAAPCDELVLDERAEGFLGTRVWSSRFDILKSEETVVEVYESPVYTNAYETGLYDIIFFTGRRWVLSHTGLLDIGQTNVSGLVDFFANFHGAYSKYEVAFISGSVDMGTPSDSVSPVGVEWLGASQKSDTYFGLQTPQKTLLSTSILSAKCNDEANPCYFDSICTNQSTCNCATGASGALCQVPPLGNGLCNPYFNTMSFAFDGGDCCESTCVVRERFFRLCR
eukprot:scaffold34585_cov221-Amphora_coffeaeformis.AAC.3